MGERREVEGPITRYYRRELLAAGDRMISHGWWGEVYELTGMLMEVVVDLNNAAFYGEIQSEHPEDR